MDLIATHCRPHDRDAFFFVLSVIAVETSDYFCCVTYFVAVSSEGGR